MDYDRIVVGAGAVGSAAAYWAARQGRRVLLLEQFAIGHARGSSHGESRIIRHSYSSADYASLAPAAFHAWGELEAERGEQLLLRTGGIDLGRANNPVMLACREALNSAGFGSVWLEGEEARTYAAQFNLPDDWAVLYQSGAGILNAGKCVAAMADEARKFGAEIIEQARVVALEPLADEVAVRFEVSGETRELRAQAAIVAAGPWAGHFFRELGLALPLRVTHQQVAYYPVEEAALWGAGRCPIYIAHGRNGFYGFPISERAGFVKVGVELDGEIADPDDPPRDVDQAALSQLNEIVASRFRGVRPEPADVVVCRYTETEDKDFIIDRHPRHPNIVLASPCSGHGFKFSILSGKLAAELAGSAVGDAGTVGAPQLWRQRFGIPARAALTGTGLVREWRG